MITPSSNTVLEPLSYRIVDTSAAAVALHFSRLPVTRVSADQGDLAQFDAAPMSRAADLLADAEVDVVAWAGTAGSWLGTEHDQDLCEVLSRRSGAVATTSTLAILEAFSAHKIRTVGLITPYRRELVDRIIENYDACGVSVVSERHLDITTNRDFAEIPPAKLRTLATEVASASPDALAFVCTNVPAAPLVDRLEQELDVLVVDSVAATLWQSLRLSGAVANISHWGRLLRDTSASRPDLSRVSIAPRGLETR